jgi:hypothetical protein
MTDEIYCQNCGSFVSAYQGCPKCGTELPFAAVGDSTGKKCAVCRMPNRRTAIYCYSCGSSFDSKRKKKPIIGQGNLNDLIKRKVEAHLEKKETETMNANFKVRKDQKRIGLWGPRAAGKTVYMVSLYLASRMSGTDNDQWNISLEDVDDESRTLFDGLADNLRKGIYPPPNPPEKGEPDLYNFVFYPETNDLANKVKISRDTEDKLSAYWNKFTTFLTEDPAASKSKENKFPGISVSFADVAGERYLLEKSDSQLWNHLAGCHGLICLIDPDDFYDQFQTTNRLGAILHQKIKNENPDALIDNKRYLPHYISLCFSKMDRPKWKEYLTSKKPDDLIAYLENEAGFSVRKILEVDFSPKRITYNFISSVGEIYEDGSGTKKRIKPQNIFQPLNEWVK